MKLGQRKEATGDRISTREELSEVFVQLIELLQLSYDDPLESLGSSNHRSQDDLEVWIDSDPDGHGGVEIESVTNIILARRQLPN